MSNSWAPEWRAGDRWRGADKAVGGAKDNRDGSVGVTSLSHKLGTCATNRRTPSTKPNEPAMVTHFFKSFNILRPGLYEMKVEKTLKIFQSFGRLQLFGLRFVFPKFQSFGRPPVLAIPALTVLILTMWTVADGPGTHLQRSSTAKRKIVSQGDSANAAAVSI